MTDNCGDGTITINLHEILMVHFTGGGRRGGRGAVTDNRWDGAGVVDFSDIEMVHSTGGRRRRGRRGAASDDGPDAARAVPPATCPSVSLATWRMMRRLMIQAVTGELEADNRVRGGEGGLSKKFELSACVNKRRHRRWFVMCTDTQRRRR